MYVPRSKERMGVDWEWSHIFTVQSAEQERNTRGWKGFHFTAYTAMWCPTVIGDVCGVRGEEQVGYGGHR
jgi:hypothetical protein